MLQVRWSSGSSQIGTLEVGKFADVVVLSKDYFDEASVSDTIIKTVRPLMTLVGGDVQYLDTGLASELGINAVGIQPEQLIEQIASWESGKKGNINTNNFY